MGEFHRFSYQGNVSSRSFDMEVTYGEKSRTFKNIDKGEFENLVRFIESKAITVRNKPVRSATRATGEDVEAFINEKSDEDDSDYSQESEEDDSYNTDDDDDDDEDGDYEAAAPATSSKRKASGSSSKPSKRSKR